MPAIVNNHSSVIGQAVIAVDGPTASGKGTLAAKLAGYFKRPYMDTGLLYRQVGWMVLEAACNPNDPAVAIPIAEQFTAMYPAKITDVSALRSEPVSAAASKVAAIPEIRALLFDLQRNFALQEGGAVLDGRDIGTVICPEAHNKFFITASAEARAMRRLKQLHSANISATYEAVLQDLQERDSRDRSRSVAQTVPAADAIVVDTTTMDAEAAYQHVLRTILAKQ